VAKVFATFRVTGQVSNGVARDLLARLQSFTDACDAVGVEVKQTVDARLDPEPVPEPEAVIELPADFKYPPSEELLAFPGVKVVIPKVRRK
jgi:hypothetical protein